MENTINNQNIVKRISWSNLTISLVAFVALTVAFVMLVAAHPFVATMLLLVDLYALYRLFKYSTKEVYAPTGSNIVREEYYCHVEEPNIPLFKRYLKERNHEKLDSFRVPRISNVKVAVVRAAKGEYEDVRGFLYENFDYHEIEQ